MTSIVFCGNVANTHFAVVAALRNAGHDAHLLVGRDDPLSWRPETDDPNLAGRYPSWIHEARWYNARDAVVPWRAPIVHKLREFDVVIASGSTPAFAQFAGRPWCFFATGGDITVRPFPWTFRHRRGLPPAQLGHGVLSAWQRRALRRADQLWLQPFQPFRDAVKRLGLDTHKIANAYFPLIIDTDTFQRDPSARFSNAPWVRSVVDRSDFIVFHPTRLVFDDSPAMRRSGQWKGSATLFEGFARFVVERRAGHPMLVLPNRRESEGVSEAKARISELGIGDYVHWAEPPRPAGFTRHELVDLYSVADVAVDEFGAGWFGFVSLEAMSCSVPVISHIDKQAIKQLYGDDWMWQTASNADELAGRLFDLAEDPSRRVELGAGCRRWIERHHAPAAAHGHYVDAVMSCVDLLANAT